MAQEIYEVGYKCTTTFSGKWELKFLPYGDSLGYDNHPALLMDRINMIIGCMNQAIEENKPKNK